jgi:subtilisin family serine protease
MGGPPTRTPGLTGRRPVVAVLDTAIGQHEWFTDDVVERDPTVDGDVIGLGGGDGSGISADPFEGVLDTDTGHGTFIAGLVHQLCPDARLLGIRIMSTSGAVREGDLLNVLWQLVRRQELAQRTGDPDLAVDIVNLSLGYYHETPKDAGYDSSLLSVLLALSRLGVAVVAAAGNGSTDRLMYPAAFAPFDEGAVAVRRDRVPLVSVGAQNPDRTVALYSNTGPWVTCYRPGANLVSTMPTLTNGGAQATFEVTLPGYPPRATLDPDSFASGFALWSGTSFAAPVLAGELAAAMVGAAMTGVGDDDRALDDVSVTACVDRAWAAISARTGIERPA